MEKGAGLPNGSEWEKRLFFFNLSSDPFLSGLSFRFNVGKYIKMFKILSLFSQVESYRFKS